MGRRLGPRLIRRLPSSRTKAATAVHKRAPQRSQAPSSQELQLCCSSCCLQAAQVCASSLSWAESCIELEPCLQACGACLASQVAGRALIFNPSSLHLCSILSTAKDI